MFGFNDTPQTLAAQAATAQRAGATIARVPVSWELTEPEAGDFDWTTLDRTVAALASNRIRVLFVISAAPRWASGDCEDIWINTCGVAPGYDPYYVRFATTLLERYPQAKVQVWNEPDIPLFGAMTARRAGELTQELYRAAPGRTIAPALSPSQRHMHTYLVRMYRRIPSAMPMAVHLYPRATRRTRDLRDEWRRSQAVAGDREVWVTEVGFAESQYGPLGQARRMVAAYRFLRNRGARAIIVHRLQDAVGEGNPWQATLGVLSASGKKKPVYRALRRVVAPEAN